MTRKKALVLVVAAAMAFQFAGCKKKEADGGVVKIKVEIFDRGTDGGKTDATSNKWTQWIKEKVLKDENLDVTFVSVNRWDEGNALVNLFAAGTPPDVCYTYSNDNIQRWADQGGIFDVAPYIDTTLKDLNEFLGPDRAIPGKRLIERQSDASTGAIYSIPARRMNLARTIVWIREDWLKILNLPLPATTEEYYNTLLAFRNRAKEIQAATGVDRVIPFITESKFVYWGPDMIMQSFIDPNLSDKERWLNDIVTRNFLMPGYKDGVRFFNRMFNDGLIDKDFPLYKSADDSRPIVQSGVVGSFVGDWDVAYREPNGLLSGLQKNIPGANLIPVDCVTDANGKTIKPIYDAAGIFYFVPKSSKNPEAALRYINWLARYDNYHFLQVGHEGITHTLVNGVPKIDPSAAKEPAWIQNSNQNIDYTLPMNGLFLKTEEESIRALASGYAWPAELLENAYRIAMNNGRPAVVIKPSSPLTEAGAVGQTLTDKSEVMFVKLITCQPSQFDAEWTAQLNEWMASGAQKVLDERKAKYPAQ